MHHKSTYVSTEVYVYFDRNLYRFRQKLTEAAAKKAEERTCSLFRLRPFPRLVSKDMIPSIQSEQRRQAFVHTRETHKGHSQQAGGHQSDGHAAHTLGYVDQCQLFTDAGKDNERQGKT